MADADTISTIMTAAATSTTIMTAAVTGGPDPCQCLCCIGDVDFAIYSRVGEQRVLPIVIENERRRETQVTAELSPWTTRGGKVAPVETVGLEPKVFTLPACGVQKVTLVVKVIGDPAIAGAADANQNARNRRGRLPGCDRRSQADRLRLPAVAYRCGHPPARL